MDDFVLCHHTQRIAQVVVVVVSIACSAVGFGVAMVVVGGRGGGGGGVAVEANMFVAGLGAVVGCFGGVGGRRGTEVVAGDF